MDHSQDNQQKEYAKYVEKKSPKSHTLRDCVWAFITGGLICVVGQVIFDLAALSGLDERQAATAMVVIMVFLGATLTGVGIYDVIGKYAGAGSVVPITGFANSVVAPAIEFKREGLILGVGSKMFAIAGPVLVYGIGASVIVGIIYWTVGVIFG